MEQWLECNTTNIKVVYDCGYPIKLPGVVQVAYIMQAFGHTREMGRTLYTQYRIQSK